MTMKSISRFFFIGMLLLLLASGFFSAYSFAKDSAIKDPFYKDPPQEDAGGYFGDLPILDGAVSSKKQYLVKLSGTVMNETFSGAQALLTLTAPVPGNKYGNPYLIIIEGFPKQNSVNSFYWAGDGSEMKAIANEITCDIKRTFIKPVDIYFYSLSPELYRHVSPTAGAEGRKLVESVALPTFIRAMAGQLKLRIYSNSVSGTVWMRGYDQVEKAFVLYSAQLYGSRVYNSLRPNLEQKKGTKVKE